MDGALFIDDDRALVWSVDGSRTDLREVLMATPEAASWQLRVTGVSTPAVRSMRSRGDGALRAERGSTSWTRARAWWAPSRSIATVGVFQRVA